MAVELIELGARRGKILRKGYTRKGGKRVKQTYVKDTGKPGKTPKSKRVLPPIKPGTLACEGDAWRHGDAPEKRMRVLRCIIVSRHVPCVTVIRDLNVVANYSERTSPATHKAAREDMERLRMQGVCLRSRSNGQAAP